MYKMKIYQCSFSKGILYLKWDTYYIFKEDVEGKEIHFHGNNITLDLNGHTIQIRHIIVKDVNNISIFNGEIVSDYSHLKLGQYITISINNVNGINLKDILVKNFISEFPSLPSSELLPYISVISI